jgi:phosphoglycolate phosphatase
MRNVGVLWGFGGREELLAAGAGRLAETPDELAAVLHG